MARAAYTETIALRTLRQLIAFAEDKRVTPAELARYGRAYVLPAAQERLRDLSPAQMLALKQELREYFHAMAHDFDKHTPVSEQRFQPTLVATPGPSGIILFVDGDPRDVLLYQASTFLQTVGTDRLRRCPAPDCSRVFVKRGRREYCSARCQRRVFLASYDPFRARSRRKDSHGKKTRTR